MAKPKLTTLKKKLWKLTSEYVRRRDANSEGYVKCCTCSTTKHWKEMQAGHFIPQAQGNAVKWDLRNIAPQDYRCNINLGGNGAEYYPFMIETYGQDIVDELRRLSHTTVKFTVSDLQQKIDEMTQLLADLD